MRQQERPDEKTLEEIARRLCFMIRWIGQTEPVTDLGVDTLRRFAAAQDPSRHAELPGLLWALLRCAEELADLYSGSSDSRDLYERYFTTRERQGLGVRSGVSLRWLETLQCPLAAPHPMVFVSRCAPLTRIARALQLTGATDRTIAKVTEPSLDHSSRFARARKKYRSKVRAEREALRQATNTVRARLRTSSFDAFVVLTDDEAKANKHLQQFGRENGYPEIDLGFLVCRRAPFPGVLGYVRRPT